MTANDHDDVCEKHDDNGTPTSIPPILALTTTGTSAAASVCSSSTLLLLLVQNEKAARGPIPPHRSKIWARPYSHACRIPSGEICRSFAIWAACLMSSLIRPNMLS